MKIFLCQIKYYFKRIKIYARFLFNYKNHGLIKDLFPHLVTFFSNLKSFFNLLFEKLKKKPVLEQSLKTEFEKVWFILRINTKYLKNLFKSKRSLKPYFITKKIKGKRKKQRKNLNIALFIINKEFDRSLKNNQKLFYSSLSLEKIKIINFNFSREILKANKIIKEKNLDFSRNKIREKFFSLFCALILSFWVKKIFYN